MTDITKFKVGKVYYIEDRWGKALFLCTNRTSTKGKERVTFRQVYSHPNGFKRPAKSTKLYTDIWHDNIHPSYEYCYPYRTKYDLGDSLSATNRYNFTWYEGKTALAKKVKILDELPYTYGVQISKLGNYDIVTHKYNFLNKADALIWAKKYTRANQYATIVKLPNRYYYKAGEYTRESTQTVLAYERGTQVGILRWYNGVAYLVHDDKEMWAVNDNGRLVNKTKSIWSDSNKYRKPQKR